MTYSKGPLEITGSSSGGGPCDDGGDYAIIEPGAGIIGEANHRISEDVYRDAKANAKVWAAAPDYALVLSALCAGVARWEGHELCVAGLRYTLALDENGCPVLYKQVRAALANEMTKRR